MDSQKSLVEAAEKYTKLLQDPKVVETLKELGHDVQKDLAVIEEGPKKINIVVKQEKVGFFTNIIAYILKFLYAGKVREMTKQIEPLNAELAENAKEIARHIENLNKLFSKPEVIELFKRHNIELKPWS